MKPKYHWTQILVRLCYQSHSISIKHCSRQGVLTCIGGLGLLVTCDLLTGKNWRAVDKGKGDAFMIAAGTLYGFSTSSTYMSTPTVLSYNLHSGNATEEIFVRIRPLHEVRLIYAWSSSCLTLGQVMGQLGMFGFIINTIQAGLLEYKLIKNGKWDSVTGQNRHFWLL